MKRIKTWIGAHVVLASIIASLVLAGGAAAAWIIYSGIGGTGNGSFAASSTIDAIDINGGTPSGPLGPGASVSLPLTLVNNDTVDHRTNTVTATFSTTPTVCASHLSSADVGNLNAITIPGGGTMSRSITVTSDGSTPIACASGTWTVAFAGTLNF